VTAPWNASWTSEDHYEIRPCRWAGGKLIERAMDRVAERLMPVQNALVKAQMALFETARAAVTAAKARP
jgi:hypothetical protein